MVITVVGSLVAISLIVVVIGGIITNFILKKNKRGKWRNAGEDVVVLHIYQRGRHMPNLSPFVLKLETYLRMAEIPYLLDFDEPLGPKGKCPWISINGEDIGDTQLIMDMLGRKFGKDFSSHLTPQQKGIALALRITLEEHFLWCMVIWRFGVDAGRSFVDGLEMPKMFRAYMPIMKRGILKTAYTQGLGRHSYHDVEGMGKKDLAAVSAVLGNNSFLMGEEPIEVDCAIFGFLAQIVWGTSTDCCYYKMLETEFTNLKPYCLRMKEKFWTDWDSCLNPQIKREEEDKGVEGGPVGS